MSATALNALGLPDSFLVIGLKKMTRFTDEFSRWIIGGLCVLLLLIAGWLLIIGGKNQQINDLIEQSKKMQENMAAVNLALEKIDGRGERRTIQIIDIQLQISDIKQNQERIQNSLDAIRDAQSKH